MDSQPPPALRPLPPPPNVVGTAGVSAVKQYERHKARDDHQADIGRHWPTGSTPTSSRWGFRFQAIRINDAVVTWANDLISKIREPGPLDPQVIDLLAFGLVGGARPPTDEDVPIALDGRLLDTPADGIADLDEINAKRAATERCAIEVGMDRRRRRPIRPRPAGASAGPLDERTQRRDQLHLLDVLRSRVEQGVGADQVGEAPGPTDRHVEPILREQEVGGAGHELR